MKYRLVLTHSGPVWMTPLQAKAYGERRVASRQRLEKKWAAELRQREKEDEAYRRMMADEEEFDSQPAVAVASPTARLNLNAATRDELAAYLDEQGVAVEPDDSREDLIQVMKEIESDDKVE